MRWRLRALGGVQIAAGVASAALVVAVLVFADRGYDLTDEGFYLNWISRPDLYSTSTTFFGFVYHPLYVVVGGDVALLRQVTVVITLGLAWIAAYVAVRPDRRSWPWPVTLAVTTALAVFALKVYDRWLLTPNYNILVMHGLLLATIGLLLMWSTHDPSDETSDPSDRPAWPGFVLLGIGGALLFLAKPPAAAVSGLLVVALLAVGGRFRLRHVLIAAASAFGPLAAILLAIDGSPAASVRRMRGGVDELQAFDPGHSWGQVLSLDALHPTPVRLALGMGTLTAVAALTWCLAATPGRRERSLMALAGGTALLLTVLVVALRPSAANSLHAAAFLMPIAVLASALLCRLAWSLRSSAGTRVGRNELVLTAGLLLLPFASTVGTAADTWRAANHYAVLWAIAAVVLLRPVVAVEGWQILTPTVAATSALAILPTALAMDQPYRQPGPVWRYDAVAVVGTDATLKLSDPTARTLTELRAIAGDAGMVADDPVIDLTGEAPGLVFAIGGQALNSAWVPGNYPGSEGFLRTSVDQLSCRQLSDVWLLDQPGGIRSVAAAYYPAVGATPDDFDVVGSVDVPPIGIPNSPVEPPIRLLRDRRAPALAERACLAAREQR